MAECLRHRGWPRRLLARTIGIACLLAGACGRGDAQGTAPAERQLVVFAAASLRDAFTAIGRDFERARPGIELSFNFAGSQQLRVQIEQGATADVFASADQRQMDALARSGRAAAPVTFARNEPVLVVAPEAAEVVRSLADLPRAARIALGAPEVPIGRYTLQVLDRATPALGPDFRARVEARIASRELDVRQVLAKVQLGEADAAIVYRSDAQAAKQLTVVSIPRALNVTAEYPIAVVSGAPHPDLARAWIALVRSAAGADALSRAGFLPAAPAR